MFDDGSASEPDTISSPTGLAAADGATEEDSDPWSASIRQVMRDVILGLPDSTSLGELVDAARSNPDLAPVLRLFTVEDLIQTAKRKPKAGSRKPGSEPEDDGGPSIIRRRADAPDGDLRVLRALAHKGPLRELEIANGIGLSPEQLRLVLRNLRTRGLVHVEGSGVKRRLKITRQGSLHLRDHERATAASPSASGAGADAPAPVPTAARRRRLR